MLHDAVLEVVEKASSTRYRGLIVAVEHDRIEAVRLLADTVGGDCVLVGDSMVRRGFCSMEMSPAGYQRLLGREFKAGIVSLDGMVRPTIVAAVAEAVRGGGFLAVVGGPPGSWSWGPRDGLGFYDSYVRSSIGSCRLHAYIEDGKLVSMRLDVGRPPRVPGGGEYRPRRIPRKLAAAAANIDQARAIDAMAMFLHGRARSFMLTGDRGRGKSYALGLFLAYAAWSRGIGRVSVLVPSIGQGQSLQRGLLEGLRVLGLRDRVRVVEGREGVVRVSGPWFRVSLETPETVEPSPLLVVDEAASIGPARVRRLSWRSGKTIVSTTIHGYEGSGRVFATLVEGFLPRPITGYRIDIPVRYPSGDPLEEWVYDVFMLRPDPPELDGEVDVDRVDYRLVSREELAGDRRLLASIYGALALAHYRMTPDSILLLLEAPHHTVHVLEYDDSIVAVVEIVDEDKGGEEAALATKALSLASGSRPQRVARVSRIAVLPVLQRRGLGSRLLGHVEEWMRREGYRIAATVYSRHEVAGFWLRNGYRLVYVSPRYNRYTGEKNLAMAKPLVDDAVDHVALAECEARIRLLEAAPSIYRDVSAETMALLLSVDPTGCRHPGNPLSPGMKARLEAYQAGGLELEQAFDAVSRVARVVLAGRGHGLGEKEAQALAARVLQGKTVSDTAYILGTGEEEASRIVDRALRKLLAGWSGWL